MSEATKHFSEHGYSKKRIEEIFFEVDSNSDGKITFEEFGQKWDKLMNVWDIWANSMSMKPAKNFVE